MSATGGVCSGGVSAWGCALGGVCSQWGVCLLPGVSAPGGSVHAGIPHTPPVNRMTNRCKNITLATTSLRPVKREITIDFNGMDFIIICSSNDLC